MDGLRPTFTVRKLKPSEYSQEIAKVQTGIMPVPDKVILLLQDFCEDFCIKSEDKYETYVKEGDHVFTGQKIGMLFRDSKQIAIRSSISGEVGKIEKVLHPMGWKVDAMTIQSDGKDEIEEQKPFKELGVEENRENLLQFFSEMGVLIDYGFPEDVSNIIINSTEFEPCFSSKKRLIQEEHVKITEGLKVLLKVYNNAKKVLFLLEKRHHDLHLQLKQTCSIVKNTDVKLVDNPYPVTLQALLRERIAFEHKNNVNKTKAMMIEPAVLIAIYDAYYNGEPFIRQLVSVVGSGVKNAGNVWVRCGTTLGQIIKARGGDVNNVKRVVMGGPLMGVPQHNLDVPLVKRAHGVSIEVALLFEEERTSRFYKKTACVRCGKCVDVCPANISPNFITDLVHYKKYDEAKEYGLFSCLECGLCYYVCPSIIPLMELMKMGKYRSEGKQTLLMYNYYKTLYS